MICRFIDLLWTSSGAIPSSTDSHHRQGKCALRQACLSKHVEATLPRNCTYKIKVAGHLPGHKHFCLHVSN
jgi:hypothetical protein